MQLANVDQRFKCVQPGSWEPAPLRETSVNHSENVPRAQTEVHLSQTPEGSCQVGPAPYPGGPSLSLGRH